MAASNRMPCWRSTSPVRAWVTCACAISWRRWSRKAPSCPQRLCFEITETAAISNLAQAREFIYSMRRLGCSFALDDFGSGMSSFAYLKELPVNQLKIDGAFVRNLTRDSLDAAIVSAICGICAQMGIITVAEYVERLELIPALELIGVDFVQGYGIGRPHPIGAPLIPITPRNNGPAASLQG